MNSKQRKTLERVFARPTRSDLAWLDIESLLKALGAVAEEGRGSRVWFYLNGRAANFHRPHPEKEAGKRTVEAAREFLTNAGVRP